MTARNAIDEEFFFCIKRQDTQQEEKLFINFCLQLYPFGVKKFSNNFVFIRNIFSGLYCNELVHQERVSNKIYSNEICTNHNFALCRQP